MASSVVVEQLGAAVKQLGASRGSTHDGASVGQEEMVRVGIHGTLEVTHDSPGTYHSVHKSRTVGVGMGIEGFDQREVWICDAHHAEETFDCAAEGPTNLLEPWILVRPAKFAKFSDGGIVDSSPVHVVAEGKAKGPVLVHS